jgi:hypothetical protein
MTTGVSDVPLLCARGGRSFRDSAIQNIQGDILEQRTRLDRSANEA